MNHFMLPTGDKVETMKGKYGDYATKKLVEMMQKLDPDINNLEAHIYGGGAVVGHLSTGAGIGIKNIDVAKTMMAEYGIKVRTLQVGGENGRKIFFNTESGVIEERLIERSEMTLKVEAKKKALEGRKIRVLVVDDSSTIRQIIVSAISSDPRIEVVGEAADPYHAREMVLELDPDVITLDIIMPKMDGITFLKKLMLYQPKPVIIVSSVAQQGSKQRVRAEEIGAVDILDKEDLKLYQGLDTTAQVLVPKIIAAAQSIVRKKNKEDIHHI
jgi:two-component system chemotaxis response regulator CheB